MLAKALTAIHAFAKADRSRGRLRVTLSVGLVAHAMVVVSCTPTRMETASADGRGVVPNLAGVDSQTPEPQFSDYPATMRFAGVRAKLETSGGGFTPMQVNALETALEDGPNFAGVFALAMWGCGTNCHVVSVVDLRTGRVYQGVVTNNLPQFRADSRLLVDAPSTPGDSLCATCARSFFVWQGVSFEQLREASKSP